MESVGLHRRQGSSPGRPACPGDGKPGFETFIIAAADTVMSRSSADLAAEVFPGVELVKEVGERETLLSIDKAKRMLGYAPEHSWRDHAGAGG